MLLACITKFTILFLLLVYVEGSRRARPRIHGGSPARPAPYHVAIIGANNLFIFMGGAIIHRRFVLTCAHGFTSARSLRNRLLAGNQDFTNNNTMVQLIHIKRIYVKCAHLHKIDYSDVALLETTPIIFDWSVQPILVYPYLMPNGTKMVVYGHGRRKDNKGSAVLQELETYYLDEDACKKLMKRKTPYAHDTLCHSPFKKGKGTCFGDSGSPVTIQGKRPAVVGVNSRIYGCGTWHPNLGMRLSLFYDFIRTTVNSAYPDDPLEEYPEED